MTVEVTPGEGPLILGLPHTGTDLPGDTGDMLNDRGQALADTDWHIERLYADLAPGSTRVRTTVHRYVIDVNRDPGGATLYPGQNTTGLCPLTDFDGQPIYDGDGPDPDEIKNRRAAYHAPYHEAIEAQIDRVKSLHGFSVLYDCHSIRSAIPFLFEGQLPALNIGTNSGATCAPAVEAAAHEFAASSPYATVLNGRFKGGWTTRHYGRPSEGIHAIQMELAQRCYLSEEAPPWRYDDAKAGRLRPWLADILDAVVEAAEEASHG